MPTHPVRAGLALAAALAIAACSNGGAAPTSPTTSTTPAASPDPAVSADPSAAGRINANTATQQELAAAFAAAGIPNADRWAQEVAEYRPYDPDPTWAELRRQLGKYNIDPQVLEQIIALLEV